MIIVDEANLIAPNLYVGGIPNNIFKYKYVFAFNEKQTYLIPNGTILISSPFDDTDCIPNTEQLYRIAGWISECRKSGIVLLHCTAGINRSVMMACLSLMHDGMSARDSIDLLRSKREMVLSNECFESWLLQHDKRK